LDNYNKKYCRVCGCPIEKFNGSMYCDSCAAYFNQKDFDNVKDIPTKKYPTYVGSGNYQYPYLDTPAKYASKHKCVHNQTKVKLGNYEIWCSEYPDKQTVREDPDVGIYLANVWMKLSPIWSTGTKRGLSFGLNDYPAVFVNWTDMDVPKFDVLCNVVNYAVQQIYAGKKVEIGCYGGHGRTGTLLACIMIKILGISGNEAIDKVHKDYCQHAIETSKQEAIIREYGMRELFIQAKK
jgi:hypothetical protein